MSPATQRILHRRLGLAFCLFTFVAAGSGIIHNVMSWTQPPPPRPAPAGDVDLSRVSLSPQAAQAALQTVAGPLKITMLALREIDGEPWYQFYVAGQLVPRYVSASDGRVDDQIDLVYGRQIASQFLGGIPVRHTDTLQAFNHEYIEIYRILPVHRFDADDGLGTRVYVSTMTGSVTRHTDHHRQLQANIFGLFHKFAFIRNKNIRNTVLTVTTSGIFLTALAGLLILLPKRGGKKISVGSG